MLTHRNLVANLIQTGAVEDVTEDERILAVLPFFHTPAVADAAVIGSPDPEAGELPKAFVVLKEKVDAETLMAFVAERVAAYKRICLIEVVDEIPKSASGKILRRLLRDRERAKQGGTQAISS